MNKPASLSAFSFDVLRVRQSQPVLVLDEDRESAEILSLLLEVRGYRTVSACDGMQAIRVAREAAPGALILRTGMPLLRASETCSHIRALPGCGSIFMVALAIRFGPEEASEAWVAGFDAYMPGPLDVTLLAGLLRSTVSPQPALAASLTLGDLRGRESSSCLLNPAGNRVAHPLKSHVKHSASAVGIGA